MEILVFVVLGLLLTGFALVLSVMGFSLVYGIIQYLITPHSPEGTERAA